MSERAGRVWHLVTFAVAVFALVFQLVLILRGDSVLDEANAPGTPEAVRRYFFYFTIQANALVAFSCWLVATRDIASSRLLRVLRLDAVLGIAGLRLVPLPVPRRRGARPRRRAAQLPGDHGAVPRVAFAMAWGDHRLPGAKPDDRARAAA